MLLATECCIARGDSSNEKNLLILPLAHKSKSPDKTQKKFETQQIRCILYVDICYITIYYDRQTQLLLDFNFSLIWFRVRYSFMAWLELYCLLADCCLYNCFIPWAALALTHSCSCCGNCVIAVSVSNASV